LRPAANAVNFPFVSHSTATPQALKGFRMRWLFTIVLTLVALSGGALPGHAARPHTREGWVVGVAYGPATARVVGADSLTSDWLDGPAQSIRIGRMFGHHFKVGYEHQAYVREQGFYDLKVRVGTQLEALAVTAYLGQPDRALGGLFVVAGTGPARCRLTFLEPLAPGESPIGDTYEIVYKQDEFGWGGFGGVGYEFQITRSFAASAVATYNYLGIGGSIFDNAVFVPLTASLNWSF